MTALVDQIANPWWQVALGNYGEVATGFDDIAQALAIILQTPKGADPLRPEFGSDVWQYIDWPITQATPHIVREVYDAVGLWEPRIDLISVTPSTAGDGSNLIITIIWRVKGAGQNQTTQVAL